MSNNILADQFSYLFANIFILDIFPIKYAEKVLSNLNIKDFGSSDVA